MDWLSRFSLLLLLSNSAYAGHAICDRTFSVEKLNKEEKENLEKGKLVLRFSNVDEYAMGYAIQDINLDPELLMGVYISANEHSSKLGGFILKSKITTPDMPKPVFRVEYTQYVKYLDDADYVVENFVTEKAGSYLLNSRLVSSNDASFAPKWLDSYLRVTRLENGGSRVIACNYQIPRSGFKKGTYNEEARSRVKRAAENFEKWVRSVAQSADLSQDYREHLQETLEGWKKKD